MSVFSGVENPIVIVLPQIGIISHANAPKRPETAVCFKQFLHKGAVFLRQFCYFEHADTLTPATACSILNSSNSRYISM